MEDAGLSRSCPPNRVACATLAHPSLVTSRTSLPPMEAILVRIGADHSYGGWNAPADPVSRRFVYVPIPEQGTPRFHRGCKRTYREILPAVTGFASQFGMTLSEIGWPSGLRNRPMHLDPDFEELTYGDSGNRRGSAIRKLARGSLLVFYSGLKSIQRDDRLIYALVGMYVVDEVLLASEVPKNRWHENAHTRKASRGVHDIVVRAVPGESGRFRQFIPIGEYRDRAYRARRDILKEWGGLTVTNGFLQRSGRPPHFLDAVQFRRWLDHQHVELLQANNEPVSSQRVIVVHLRRPNRGDPDEMRTDPFWEFGSFGCTGCHAKNLLNPRRAHELSGARLAFAQGGPEGFRLIKLTPPVNVINHSNRAELRWSPHAMPFRYAEAPLLIDNEGQTDFPSIGSMLSDVNRLSWEAAFSSRFRSRREPLPKVAAAEVIATYERLRRQAPADSLASTYDEALPYRPPRVDRDRRYTYRKLLATLGVFASKGIPLTSCGRKRGRRGKRC